MYDDDALWLRLLLQRFPGTPRCFKPFELPKNAALRSLAQWRLRPKLERHEKLGLDPTGRVFNRARALSQLQSEYVFELTVRAGRQVSVCAVLRLASRKTSATQTPLASYIKTARMALWEGLASRKTRRGKTYCLNDQQARCLLATRHRMTMKVSGVGFTCAILATVWTT